MGTPSLEEDFDIRDLISLSFWSLGSLVAVQIGYLGGIYLRSVLEHVGIGVPDVHPRRHS
jgi:hypothetical protein